MSLEQQKIELLKTAAQILWNDIRTLKTDFLNILLGSKSFENAWAQNIIATLWPQSGPIPGQLGLELMLDHKFGSKLLIMQLHKLGYCSSYSEVLRYKWSYLIIKAQNKLDVIPAEVQISDDIGVNSDDDELSVIDDEESTAPDHSISDDTDGNCDSDSKISFDEPLEEEGHVVLDEVVQFVGDNLDIDIRSKYGNNSFHAMGRFKKNIIGT